MATVWTVTRSKLDGDSKQFETRDLCTWCMKHVNPGTYLWNESMSAPHEGTCTGAYHEAGKSLRPKLLSRVNQLDGMPEMHRAHGDEREARNAEELLAVAREKLASWDLGYNDQV